MDCNGCSREADCNEEANNCEQPAASAKRIMGQRNHIKQVIAVMSGKGGVGKSSVSALLACSLHRRGYQVGLLDADITGPSQGQAFGIHLSGIGANEFGMVPPVSLMGIKVLTINYFLPEEDDPVIWRGPMLIGIINQFWQETDWGELDYLIVDLPPGTGDVPLTVMQSLPLTGAVVVSSPQHLAAMIVRKTVKMAHKMQTPVLGLIENMSYITCSHCGEREEWLGKSQGAEIAAEMGMPFLGRLPFDSNLNQAMDLGIIEQYSHPEIDLVLAKIG